MKNQCKRIIKICLLLAIAIGSVTMSFAATYDENGENIEKLPGYISVAKIKAEPYRYLPIMNREEFENERGYLDTNSVKITKNNGRYADIEAKEIYVSNGKNPKIDVLHMLYTYELDRPNAISYKTVYMNTYTHDGQFAHNNKIYRWYKVRAFEYTNPYINGNTAFIIAYNHPYHNPKVEGSYRYSNRK